MTVEDVRRECAKRGWHLLRRTQYRLSGDETVTWLVVDPAKRDPLGTADTPKAAYLDACEREGVAPF